MWLYRWLLRLCPTSLRREYGGAMQETFARRLSDSRSAGVWQSGHVWRRELAGLLALAASKRWSRRRGARAAWNLAGRRGTWMSWHGRSLGRRRVRPPAPLLSEYLRAE
jgi:hypothetical protein